MNRATIPKDPVGRAGFFVFLALAFSLLAVLGSSLFGGGDEVAENPTLFTVAASVPDGGSGSDDQTTSATDPAPTVTSATTPTATSATTPTPFPTADTTAAAPTTVPAASATPTDGSDQDDDGEDEDGDPTPEPTATPEATPEPTATPEADGSDQGDDGEDEDGEADDEGDDGENDAAPAPTAVAVSSSFARTLKATGDVAVAEVFDAPNGEGVARQVTYTYLDGNTVRNDLTNPTYFGNPLVFRVLEGQPGDAWAKIMVPTRPNGQVGWIQTDLYEWGSSNYLIQIDVGTNQVAVFENDELILQTDAVTGKESSPTPLLTAFVDEKIYGRGGPYGPVILSLGVYSNALNTFGANGEVPKIALHGTNQPELLGDYASNGCIRIENDVITQIADLVPVGTKVEIVRS